MGRKAKVEIVLDCAEPTRLAEFWCAALGYRDYYTDANLAVLVSAEGTASPLLLQRVPEPKAGKNRMHIDIAELRGNPMGRHVGPGAERLLRLDRHRMAGTRPSGHLMNPPRKSVT